MDDSVTGIHHPEMSKSELLGVGGKSIDLFLGNRILDRLVLVMGQDGLLSEGDEDTWKLCVHMEAGTPYCCECILHTF